MALKKQNQLLLQRSMSVDIRIFAPKLRIQAKTNAT